MEGSWRRYVEHWRANRQYLAEQAAHELLADLGLTALEDELRGALVADFTTVGQRAELELTPNVASCLRALRDAGIRIGIVCDVGMTPSRILRDHLDRHGVLTLFDHWSFSDEVGWYKPDRRIFEHALSGLGGVEPSRCRACRRHPPHRRGRCARHGDARRALLRHQRRHRARSRGRHRRRRPRRPGGGAPGLKAAIEGEKKLWPRRIEATAGVFARATDRHLLFRSLHRHGSGSIEPRATMSRSAYAEGSSSGGTPPAARWAGGRREQVAEVEESDRRGERNAHGGTSSCQGRLRWRNGHALRPR